MSLDTDLYIRNAKSPAIGAKKLQDFITAAVKQGIVAGEWAIHLGPFSNTTLKVPGSLVTREKKPFAEGEAVADLLSHLAKLPWGTKDIAICVGGLNEENAAIEQDMSDYSYYNVDVIFLALAKPQTIKVTAVMDENDRDDEDESDDEDDGQDEDEDDDDSDDEDEGDNAPFVLQDAWILTGQGGPLWDDLDAKSHLIVFAKKYFGKLSFGEIIL